MYIKHFNLHLIYSSEMNTNKTETQNNDSRYCLLTVIWHTLIKFVIQYEIGGRWAQETPGVNEQTYTLYLNPAPDTWTWLEFVFSEFTGGSIQFQFQLLGCWKNLPVRDIPGIWTLKKKKDKKTKTPKKNQIGKILSTGLSTGPLTVDMHRSSYGGRQNIGESEGKMCHGGYTPLTPPPPPPLPTYWEGVRDNVASFFKAKIPTRGPFGVLHIHLGFSILGENISRASLDFKRKNLNEKNFNFFHKGEIFKIISLTFSKNRVNYWDEPFGVLLKSELRMRFFQKCPKSCPIFEFYPDLKYFVAQISHFSAAPPGYPRVFKHFEEKLRKMGYDEHRFSLFKIVCVSRMRDYADLCLHMSCVFRNVRHSERPRSAGNVLQRIPGG